MTVKTITIKSVNELAEYVKTNIPSFYFSSQTSTVIPYETVERLMPGVALVNINLIPASMQMNGENIMCRGSVTWKESRQFARQNERQIMTYPTEELANVLAGVATSCTGERCFGFGTLRDQIESLKYIDFEGNEQQLNSNNKLSESSLFKGHKDLLARYQDNYAKYKKFKNAPFPRLDVETDLLTGTEGQLGIVSEVTLKTTTNDNLNYLFFALDPWEKSTEKHLDIFNAIQNFRDLINSCELLDSNSLSYLTDELIPVKAKDLIFLEVPEKNFEKVYEGLLQKIDISEDAIFEMNGSKFHQLRVAVPRAIFEKNSQMGVTKKGTDVQVPADKFKDLFSIYRQFSLSGIRYNLFGHFGDAHLHFNFMPNKNEEQQCHEMLLDLYRQVKQIQGSPFAEHGIGLLKQEFIKDFWGPVQEEMFKFLKNKLDPKSIFFPHGFMNR